MWRVGEVKKLLGVLKVRCLVLFSFSISAQCAQKLILVNVYFLNDDATHPFVFIAIFCGVFK